ncbi:MAG: BsuPI-related putative proteinase inhibitor [Natronomonas sp.]
MLNTVLEVTVGDGVEFRLTLSNGGDTPIELTFRDGCRVDFAAVSDGDTVWRYSDGRMFTQAISTADLQPGESATFTATWNDPEPGDYTAEATLRTTADSPSATERTPFSV